jgi:alkylation response protein AidB-like acyl-CoA dehydrogenase
MAALEAKPSPGAGIAEAEIGGLTLPRLRLDRLPEISEIIAASAADHDRTGAFPRDAMALIHEAGLLTAPVHPRYGGAGAGFRDIATILLSLGGADPSVALIAAMTMIPHALHARRPWLAPLYQRILDESALAPTLLNHARAEPDPGAHGRGPMPATSATRTAAGWLINGKKRYVTGAEGLSYFLVWATTDEPAPQVGIFAVRGGAPGVGISPTWHQLGMRATGSHEVTFSNVEVPDGDVVEVFQSGDREDAAGGAILVISSSLYLGIARAAQRHVYSYGHERVPPAVGKPLATTERFKIAAGEIEALLSTAEQLIFAIADRLDRGEVPPASDSLAAKVLVVRNVTAAVQLGVRLLGNSGLAQGRPLERHFRDIQSAGVHAPQEDTALTAIGSAALAAALEAGDDARSAGA